MKTVVAFLLYNIYNIFYFILFFCFILLDSYSDAVHNTTNLRYLQCKFLDLFFR